MTDTKKEYNAVYAHYLRNMENGNLSRAYSRCKVIGETARSYRIKLTDTIQRRSPGEELWVRKKSVFRSRFNNVTARCDIYNIEVREESCKACLQNCYRNRELLYSL